MVPAGERHAPLVHETEFVATTRPGLLRIRKAFEAGAGRGGQVGRGFPYWRIPARTVGADALAASAFRGLTRATPELSAISRPRVLEPSMLPWQGCVRTIWSPSFSQIPRVLSGSVQGSAGSLSIRTIAVAAARGFAGARAEPDRGAHSTS